MKNFIKENWFKVGIIFVLAIIAFSVYYSLVSIPNREKKEIRLAQEQATFEELNSPQSDNYVVYFDDNNNPVNWVMIDKASVILDDTLSTYKNGLSVYKDVYDKEKQNVSKAYSLLPQLTDWKMKQDIQTLINYEESYIAALDKVIGMLTSLVTNYEGLQKVTTMRDPELYLYYSDEIKKIESQKHSIMEEVMTTEKAKQDYAKSQMTN